MDAGELDGLLEHGSWWWCCLGRHCAIESRVEEGGSRPFEEEESRAEGFRGEGSVYPGEDGFGCLEEETGLHGR